MCNYEKSCEMPLLEGMGNQDFFISGIFYALENGRSHSSGSTLVSATRSITPQKILWPCEGTLKFPFVLSVQTYILWHDPVHCCGGRQIWKAFCKGKRVHFFLCTVILSFDYPPSKYDPKHFMKYFSYNPYYFGYVYLHPALMSAQWNLMKLPTFVIGMTEHGGEALCMTLFISFLFSVVCTFGYWMFCNVLTLWSLRD